MTPTKLLFAVLALAFSGCDRTPPDADVSRQRVPIAPKPSPEIPVSQRTETAGGATEISEVKALYDPLSMDQSPGWKNTRHPYTWPPNDKFWDIRRFKPGDPRKHTPYRELFPDYPRQDKIVQKRPFSLKPEDFDAHCAAEEKAGRVGLLMVEPHKYAFCVKSANGLWVAVPGKPVKTHQELWPIIAKSVGPGNEGDLYPIIGGAVEDLTLGLYGTGPGEADQ